MFVSASITFALFTAPFASAIPFMQPRNDSLPPPDRLPTNCSLTGAVINFPFGQTALTTPYGTPKVVALGDGVQNYTCNGGVWTSIGAVANLYDISCALGSPLAGNLSDPRDVELLLNIAEVNDPVVTQDSVNTTQGILPRFSKGYCETSNDYGIYVKNASLPSPTNTSENIPWLELQIFEGNFSSAIYRVDTFGGEPPATCYPGKDTDVLSVHYHAAYYFY